MAGGGTTDEDDAYRSALRSMFAEKGDGDGDDDENGSNSSDDHPTISSHTWTDDSGSVTVHYHLALTAPGHGDTLWNSSSCIAEHLFHPPLRRKLFGVHAQGEAGLGGMRWPPRRTLEFGAGAALPSMVLLRERAGVVVMTDRKANDETFRALELSAEKNCKTWGIGDKERQRRVVIAPHTWGEDAKELLSAEEGKDDNEMLGTGGPGGGNDGGNFDLLVASDCIYNPTYHEALLRSASVCIDRSEGLFVVGYSFHGNVPPERVTKFFDLAESSSSDEEYGGFVTVSEFKKEYDGQSGIGGSDPDRGAVYVRVLAHRESKYCRCPR